MYVDGVGSTGDAVWIAEGGDIFLPRNRVCPEYAARLAYACLYGDGADVAVSELREVVPQHGGHAEHLLAQLAFGAREVAVVGGVAGGAGHVDSYDSRLQGGAEPWPAELRYAPFLTVGQQFVAYLFAVAVDPLPVVVHRLLHAGCGCVYAAEHEVGGHGLKGPALVGLHGHAGMPGKVRVAGAVYENLGLKGLGAVFVVDEDGVHVPVAAAAAAEVGMHVEVHSGLQDHTLAAEFVELGLERHVAQGLLD